MNDETKLDELIRQKMEQSPKVSAPAPGWDVVADRLNILQQQSEHAFDRVIRQKIQATPPLPADWSSMVFTMSRVYQRRVYVGAIKLTELAILLLFVWFGSNQLIAPKTYDTQHTQPIAKNQTPKEDDSAASTFTPAGIGSQLTSLAKEKTTKTSLAQFLSINQDLETASTSALTQVPSSLKDIESPASLSVSPLSEIASFPPSLLSEKKVGLPAIQAQATPLAMGSTYLETSLGLSSYQIQQEQGNTPGNGFAWQGGIGRRMGNTALAARLGWNRWSFDPAGSFSMPGTSFGNRDIEQLSDVTRNSLSLNLRAQKYIPVSSNLDIYPALGAGVHTVISNKMTYDPNIARARNEGLPALENLYPGWWQKGGSFAQNSWVSVSGGLGIEWKISPVISIYSEYNLHLPIIYLHENQGLAPYYEKQRHQLLEFGVRSQLK